MTEIPATYTSLPEDLVPIEGKSTWFGLVIRIGNHTIGISRSAHEAIGKPKRVQVLLGAKSRMLAMRPVDTGGYSVSVTAGSLVQLARPALIAALKLPLIEKGTTRSFTAQLIDGALLIGPLPEAKS